MAGSTPQIKIAVLTSGGDSAGMNAVVRAVVRTGIIKYVSPVIFVQVRFSTYSPIEAAKLTSYAKVMKDWFVGMLMLWIQAYPPKPKSYWTTELPFRKSSKTSVSVMALSSKMEKEIQMTRETRRQRRLKESILFVLVGMMSALG